MICDLCDKDQQNICERTFHFVKPINECLMRKAQENKQIIEELEKIKAEVEEIRTEEPLMSRGFECYGFKDKTPEDIKTEVIELLDERISELKGENK